MKIAKKRYLILADGSVFEGYAFGADVPCIGELVFTTGMCGYIETLTDPSYFGQIVLQTFPLIGNYGIIPSDFEGACRVSGYAVREVCEAPSNFRCEYGLDEFLTANNIPGIYGIDTRRVTEIIRESGVMNACLSDTPDAFSPDILSYSVKDAVSHVTCDAPHVYGACGKHNVTLVDYGAKMNIVRELVRRDCRVTVVPASVTSAQILSGNPDGVMLSNGPGDPAENTAIIAELKKLAGRVPLFGICLGHQLMALACGAQTQKLKYGHRGVNQPVRDLTGGRTYITSQNHGYAVTTESMKTGEVRYINANDGTCEGIDYPELNAFTVQFHPEAASGPHDTSFLFDRFISMISEKGADAHAVG